MKGGSIPMTSQSLLLTLVLTTVVSLTGTVADEQIPLPMPIDSYCPSTINDTSTNSIVQRLANIAQLVRDLHNGAINNSGFFFTSFGDEPDKVFGLVMCYINYNWTMCVRCLEAAFSFGSEQCQDTWQAGAMYDACALRYSKQSFYSVASKLVYINQDFGSYDNDIVGINETRWKLMSGLVPEASGSSLKFANGSLPYTDPHGIVLEMYGLMQCSRDLAQDECTKCLNSLLTQLANNRNNNTAGHLRSYSCYGTYSMEPIKVLSTPPSDQPSSPSPASAAPSSKHGKRKLTIAMSAVIGSIFCLVILACHCWRRLKRRTNEVDQLDSFGDEQMKEEFRTGAGPRQFCYRELVIATGNFADSEKLGEGGFGSVYRGHMKDLSLDVAIKRVSKSSKQGRKEYASEVRIISRLRHRNLVQLIGWCHGGGELLLVYELMPNGSLDTHLYNIDNILSWPMRHDIVLGIGYALLYLHQEWEQCVQHRDIKPSNVMLDGAFNAKLGDFRLARLVDHSQGSHTTELAGTTGYMDPECMRVGRASIESDIYSFGVVLLEISTGRRPVVVLPDDTVIHLAQRVSELYEQGRILDAVDQRLNGEFDVKEMERVMVVGLLCTCHDSSLRPSIRQAINALRFEAPLPNHPLKMSSVLSRGISLPFLLSHSHNSGQTGCASAPLNNEMLN